MAPSPTSVKSVDTTPRTVIAVPESWPVENCTLGTIPVRSRAVFTPSRSSAAAESAVTASGVSSRLVARLDAVTTTSSSTSLDVPTSWAVANAASASVGTAHAARSFRVEAMVVVLPGLLWPGARLHPMDVYIQLGQDFVPMVNRGTTQQSSAPYNRRIVLDVIRRHGSMSRKEIVDTVSL